MRRLSGLHAGALSEPLPAVRRRGAALPSAGTIQRSEVSFFSSYAGSVSEKTTHLPSGDGAGDPTRFIRNSVSWVTGGFADCARAAAGRAARARSVAIILRGVIESL